MVDDFIKRKHDPSKIAYDPPELESILKETHGVIVYQEQVMAIANRMAGFSLGQADLLRRAMGKKKHDEMAKQKERFLDGAKTNGFTEKKAEKIFDQMAYFAGYGFNKSHSAAYAHGDVPNGLPESASSHGIHGRVTHERNGKYGQDGGLFYRMS